MEEVMGFRCCLFSGVLGVFRRVSFFAGAAIVALLLSVAQSLAGGLSAQPADSLNVTNSTNGVLPQVGGAMPGGAGGAGVGVGAGGVPGETGGMFAGFHVSGYASQTFGMWQNPTALKDYTPSRNNLSVARTLLQVDENYRLNENNTFFMREWFVYEPPYSFNSANNGAWSTASPNKSSFGHFMNGYYNTFQVRDAWWENKTGPLTTFIGNQIVVWGQSLAFRVGDVVNPADTCWAFGFANLEQSRNAQWMIHPVLNLPEWGPLNSNFVEGVWQPGFAPNYWNEQRYDPYGKYIGEGEKAGRALPCLPSASHGPSARFDVHYTNLARAGLTAPLVTGTNIANPLGHEFWACGALSPGVKPGFNPLPPALRNFNCKLGLSKNNNPYAPIGDRTLIDIGVWNIPGYQPQNWNEGVRFHTLWGATEFTALYYNDNMNGGVPWTAKWTPLTNLWTYSYPDIQNVGITADRPLPVPAMIAESFPAVGRAEMIYSNHNSFPDMSPFNFTGQGWSDVVKWMVAIDLDQAYAPWLTKTGNLSANLEVYDSIIMDLKKTYTVGNAVDANPPKNDVSILFNVGTSWWWSDFEPTYTMIFQPKGRNMALFPSIILNPPWTKKYFLKLQAIEVLGGANNNGLGLFKGQSMLTAQFQYNFNLM
jgi:hypothetical protein